MERLCSASSFESAHVEDAAVCAIVAYFASLDLTFKPEHIWEVLGDESDAGPISRQKGGSICPNRSESATRSALGKRYTRIRARRW